MRQQDLKALRWKFVVMLILIALAIWYILVGRYQHTVGSGSAGPLIDSKPFQQTWSKEKTVLIGIGDSITAGYGASPKHSYFELLTENDNNLYPEMKGIDLKHVFPQLQTYNYSVSYTVSEEHP